jgi:hypothetical protein
VIVCGKEEVKVKPGPDPKYEDFIEHEKIFLD